jgi:hypothetical protein
MFHCYLFGIASVLLFATTSGAVAETQDIDITGHWVEVRRGEQRSLPNGSKVTPGGEAHASVIFRDSGAIASQWCAVTVYEHEGKAYNRIGSCGVFYDEGDVVWLAFLTTSPEDAGTWTALGGTGRYAGATGGGSCRMLSRRSDGLAYTTTCTGTLTTR